MTLIDSRAAILAAWEHVTADTGVRIDLAEVDQRMGAKLEDEAAHWFPPDQISAAADRYREHYVRLAPARTTALPGAHAALDAVRAAGAVPVIITAKHEVSVAPSISATGLTAARIYTHVHGPEKAAVLTRIQAVAYVGDTPPDMAAARTAGVRAVGVATGSFDVTGLAAAGADVVLSSLEEFPEWFAGAFPGF
jgi:phosphoglycolate phosphatase